MIEICSNKMALTKNGIVNYVKFGKLIPNKPVKIDPVQYFCWGGEEKVLIESLKNDPLLIVTIYDSVISPQVEQNIEIENPVTESPVAEMPEPVKARKTRKR